MAQWYLMAGSAGAGKSTAARWEAPSVEELGMFARGAFSSR